jgi:hypothetical protein
MNVEQAYKIALKMSCGMPLVECVDIRDMWAFYFDDAPQASGGHPFHTVNKETGKLGILQIPPMKNLYLIQSGEKVDIKSIDGIQ